MMLSIETKYSLLQQEAQNLVAGGVIMIQPVPPGKVSRKELTGIAQPRRSRRLHVEVKMWRGALQAMASSLHTHRKAESI